jgi:hypothetical protein
VGGILDPWLCVPVFQRVCLYRTNYVKFQQKEPGFVPGSRRTFYFIFGNLAVITAFYSFRPLALRPRFSTGLLFSDLANHIIATGYKILPNISAKTPCNKVNSKSI